MMIPVEMEGFNYQCKKSKYIPIVRKSCFFSTSLRYYSQLGC